MLENSCLFQTGTVDKTNFVIYPSKISTRDPRFKGRNNVAEKTIFSYKWINDIGLRKEIRYLIMPYRVTAPFYTVGCDVATTGDGESFWIHAYRKSADEYPLEDKLHIVKYDSVYTSAAD